MIQNDVKILESIVQADYKDVWCTGDSTFSLVELLKMALPDGCVVTEPMVGDFQKEDLVDNETWKSVWDADFEEIKGTYEVGFSVVFHQVPRDRVFGVSSEDDEDFKSCIEWNVETIKRLLDLQGRYSNNAHGPKAGDYIGALSLWFGYEIKGNTAIIRYFLDDSTR